MRKVFNVKTFYGGMNNVVPAHILPDNQAELIENLKLGDDGVLTQIGLGDVALDLSATYMADAVLVYQWKPATVPLDCIDDFVYIVFYSDGDCKMVYRGNPSEGSSIYNLGLRARSFAGTPYYALSLTGITEDIDGASSTATTSTNQYAYVTRRYYDGTSVSVTAPADVGAGTAFYRWVDADGAVLGESATLTIEITASVIATAEYTAVPMIRIETETGGTVTLEIFYSVSGDPSSSQSYYVGGLFLEADLVLTPPATFEVSLDEETWYDSADPLVIAQATANAGMTLVYVRYVGSE